MFTIYVSQGRREAVRMRPTTQCTADYTATLPTHFRDTRRRSRCRMLHAKRNRQSNCPSRKGFTDAVRRPIASYGEWGTRVTRRICVCMWSTRGEGSAGPWSPRPQLPISRTSNAPTSTVQHMRVDHRRADIAVAQQFLYRADIVAALVKLRRERMPLMPRAA